MAENCIGAAIWKWNFNGITSNVWRVLAEDDAPCRQVVKNFFGIGAAIWKWSFNRITLNVWWCWRKMMHNAAELTKRCLLWSSVVLLALK